MLYELIVITKSNSHEAWGYTLNRYYLDTTDPISSMSCRERLRPLFEMFQRLLKVDMAIIGIVYRGLESEGNTPGSGIAVYPTHQSHGERFVSGETRYRYALQLNFTTRRGRHGKTWIRGALDTGDLNETENNKIALKDRSNFDGALQPLQQTPNHALALDLVPRPVYTSPTRPSQPQKYRGIYVRGVANAHATTRVRFGVESKGTTILPQIIQGVELMARTLNFVNERFISDGAFTFADVFTRGVGALGTPKVIVENLKDYFKDADEKEENGDAPPITRFGMTCEGIKSAFQKQADNIELELPELQKIYHPYTDPFTGQDYIKKEDMQPYLDMLESAITATAGAVSFDGYNPNAYEGQKPKKIAETAPEFVKMAL
jgi:hypothetical protein